MTYDEGAELFLDLEIFERDGWLCGVCGIGVDPDLCFPDPRSVTLDHIIPLSRGGPHARSNAQPAHLECNQRKNDKAPGRRRVVRREPGRRSMAVPTIDARAGWASDLVELAGVALASGFSNSSGEGGGVQFYDADGRYVARCRSADPMPQQIAVLWTSLKANGMHVSPIRKKAVAV